ncbi:hypothetical protein [Spirosoma linguale]|uniref:hypothetical protein n=1 Tax=Spirosoma linguale TaxID=108 RepID=UPI0001A3B8E2
MPETYPFRAFFCPFGPIFNTKLLSTDLVKVLLGRKSDKGLEVYGRPDERRVVGEMDQSRVLQARKIKLANKLPVTL